MSCRRRCDRDFCDDTLDIGNIDCMCVCVGSVVKALTIVIDIDIDINVLWKRRKLPAEDIIDMDNETSRCSILVFLILIFYIQVGVVHSRIFAPTRLFLKWIRLFGIRR